MASRVLACALCKQRRVKCSRTFPCSNCVRAGAACVQPTVKPRRRRFAERALLERVRHYEELLRQHGVPFAPLHGGEGKREKPDVWQSMERVSDDDDDSHSDSSAFDHVDGATKAAVASHDHLLFGMPTPGLCLTAWHPGAGQMFQLWQVYLERVNPLLQVTHAPTLQRRIVEGAGGVAAGAAVVGGSLEALLFGVYCAAVQTLTDEECRGRFGQPRTALLDGYQTACQQALLRCAPWRSSDRDSLTALYLYLVSISQQVDPLSLGCMAAVAMRIGERMGLARDAGGGGGSGNPFEREMRRRLWWALVLLDRRLREMARQPPSTKMAMAMAGWDCPTPLNVNDFELQPDMRTAPAAHDGATEALFVVVRSEMADLGGPEDNDNDEDLEARLHGRLAHCRPDVPLHFLTLWTTRGALARFRLMGCYRQAGRHRTIPVALRRAADGHAVRMVTCDTELRTAPLVRGFLWLVEMWLSPVLAYQHILHRLADDDSDDSDDNDDAWEALCTNYIAVADGPAHHRTRAVFAVKLAPLVLRAWDGRLARRQRQDRPSEQPPRLVVEARVACEGVQSILPMTPGPGLSVGAEPAGQETVDPFWIQWNQSD